MVGANAGLRGGGQVETFCSSLKKECEGRRDDPPKEADDPLSGRKGSGREKAQYRKRQ